MKLRIILGRVAYALLQPFIKLALRNSHRAYIVIECNGRVLLVKNVLGSGKWHLPGGGCKKNESYEQAVIREAREEVGIDIGLVSDQMTNVTDEVQSEYARFSYRVFKVTYETKPELCLSRFEIADAAWVDPGALLDDEYGEDVRWVFEGLRASPFVSH